MKFISLFTLLTLTMLATKAQDGRLLEKNPMIINDQVKESISTADSAFGSRLDDLNFFNIVYLSDGLRVKGILVEPKASGKYPCIIANRGGNREFGKWKGLGVAYFLGKMADWGYVVIASQYRGVDGGEGTEEFGGKDLNDVLNLIPVLEGLAKADTARIGIEGGSRGGMMTYLAMKSSCRFKAACVIAGSADLLSGIKNRPVMETNVYSQLIPNYASDKEAQLKARSAVHWADKMCVTTPLLIMHGSADWRVQPTASITLVQNLLENKHPTRFILFEGADHGIREYRKEMYSQMKRHFDYYLKNQGKLPNMEPHGR